MSASCSAICVAQGTVLLMFIHSFTAYLGAAVFASLPLGFGSTCPLRRWSSYRLFKPWHWSVSLPLGLLHCGCRDGKSHVDIPIGCYAVEELARWGCSCLILWSRICFDTCNHVYDYQDSQCAPRQVAICRLPRFSGRVCVGLGLDGSSARV